MYSKLSVGYRNCKGIMQMYLFENIFIPIPLPQALRQLWKTVRARDQRGGDRNSIF